MKLFKLFSNRISLYRLFLFLASLCLLVFLVLNRKKINYIVFPFVIGLLISYILNPLVVFITKKGIERPIAVILIYFILIGSVIIGLVYIIPVILIEVNVLIDTIPLYTRKAQTLFNEFRNEYRTSLPQGFKEVLDTNIEHIESFLLKQLQNTTNITIGLFSNLSSFILGPVIGFYILKDIDKIKNTAKYLKEPYKEKIIWLLKTIDATLGRYIRSQLIICVIVTFLTTVALYIIGVDFAILIGIVAGVANIIPYFGPIIGAVPAVIIAILKYPHKVIWIIIAMIIIHQLESIIISPHIVGESVGIHPITVIFSLLVGGTFFGFWGLILAVPIAALIKLLSIPYLEQD